MDEDINAAITAIVKIANRFRIFGTPRLRVEIPASGALQSTRVYRDPSEFELAGGFSAFLGGGATSFKVEGKCASANTVPSGLRIRRTRPIRAPFLGGITSTMTTSPGLIVVLCQPASERDAEFPSSTQCCTFPLSSVTSSFIKLCGLAKTHAVTTPFIVTVFS